MTGKESGEHHRRGLSLREFYDMFPDDDAAEAWFVRVRWPDGVTCPKCGSTRVRRRRRYVSQPFRCGGCRQNFSVRTNTLMHGSKLGYWTWLMALYQLTTNLKGVSSRKLRRDLGVTQKTAWYLAHRIREAWEDAVTEDDPGGGGGLFEGPVEIDETYVGGKRRNMHAWKRREMRGRGPVGKVAIFGARDRATGRIRVMVRLNPDRQTFRFFVRNTVRRGAMLYTDGDNSYRRMPGYRHEAVNHGAGEYVRGMVHTNGVESFWAMLKRAHKGTYHRFSRKHLWRYADEFAGRHNDRSSDTLDQMANMARGLDGKRLPYAVLIKDAPGVGSAEPT